MLSCASRAASTSTPALLLPVTRAAAEFSAVGAQLVSKVQIAEAAAQDANRRYVTEQAERRRLYNKLQEARGNIRVICRSRWSRIGDWGPRHPRPPSSPACPLQGGGDAGRRRRRGQARLALRARHARGGLGPPGRPHAEARDLRIRPRLRPRVDTGAGLRGGAGAHATVGGRHRSHSSNVSSPRLPPAAHGHVCHRRLLLDDLCLRAGAWARTDGGSTPWLATVLLPPQTGSGKTHTMEGGPGEQRGIYTRALADLFGTIRARSKEYTYTTKVSMVEIYKCGGGQHAHALEATGRPTPLSSLSLCAARTSTTCSRPRPLARQQRRTPRRRPRSQSAR